MTTNAWKVGDRVRRGSATGLVAEIHPSNTGIVRVEWDHDDDVPPWWPMEFLDAEAERPSPACERCKGTGHVYQTAGRLKCACASPPQTHVFRPGVVVRTDSPSLRGVVQSTDSWGVYVAWPGSRISYAWSEAHANLRVTEDYCDQCHYCEAGSATWPRESCAECKGTGDALPHAGCSRLDAIHDAAAARHCPRCPRCNDTGTLHPPERGACPACSSLTASGDAPSKPLTMEQLERGLAAGRARLAEIERERAHYPHRCPRCGGPAYVGLREYECAADCEREEARKAAEVDAAMSRAGVVPARWGRMLSEGVYQGLTHGDDGAAYVGDVHPTRDGALALLRAQVERLVRGR